MFTRGYHGISIVLSVLALLLCPLFHPCTGERNVFIWVSENCSYTYTSTRIYAAYIYIYTYICVYYTYIYIYTHHTALYYLCMYSASLSCQQPRSRPRYLCMYYAPFLLDMGVKMGYFSLKFRHFRREYMGTISVLSLCISGFSHTFQTQPVACWFGADAWCAYALPDHWNPYFGIFLSQFHLHILLHILDHSISLWCFSYERQSMHQMDVNPAELFLINAV